MNFRHARRKNQPLLFPRVFVGSDIIVSVNETRRTGHLLTEKVNPRTVEIDELSCSEIIELVNREDRAAFEAVSGAKNAISDAAGTVFRALASGGRLFFVGAGTSGRLGVLEAAECPPTFGTDPGVVKAVMAGGPGAVWNSIEGAEDSLEDAPRALREERLSPTDVVIGVAASSETPFVRSALDFAHATGCPTVLVTCSPTSPDAADRVIELLCGPEVIVGSTRLKAGTATKMTLNMITTTAMVLLGKTYGNLMVDLQPKSAKLVDRAKRIIASVCEVDEEEATRLFSDSGRNVKTAVVAKLMNVSPEEARGLLEKNGGFLKKTLRGRVSEDGESA